jgi:hypothetical protein
MVGKDEARTGLLDRMLGAGTGRDVEIAEASVGRWSDGSPGDPRVPASYERLEERGAEIRDPERGADPAPLAVFVVAFSAAVSVMFVPIGLAHAALIAAPIVAFGMSWDDVGEAIAEWRYGPGLSGRENGER